MQARRIVFKFSERHERRHLDVAARERFGVGHLAAAAGKVARDVAHVGFRSRHLNGDDGLEHLGRSLRERVKEGFAAGGNEGHFLGVDRVALAVVNGDANVFNRVARDEAGRQNLAHAFFNRRDEVVGDDAALDLIDEFEALAAFERFDAQVDLAELSGAARLLLVAGMAFRRRGNGFAIGDRGSGRFNFKLEVGAHAVEDRAHVHVGEAADDGFVEDRIVLDRHRRVFALHLCEHFVHAAFVAPACRTNGKTVHRTREVDGTHADAAVHRIAVNDGTVLKFVDLGESTDVARRKEIRFLGVLALQNERARRLDRLLAVVDVKDGVSSDRALMHAEDADLADEGVVHDLEDLSNDRKVLVRIGAEGRPVLLLEERLIGFAGMRQVADDHLHEVADADEVLRRSEADRDDVTLAERLGDERVQKPRVDMAFLEVALEHFVVLFDHALDEGAMNVLNGHDVAVAVLAVEAVDDVRAVARREVDGQDARSPRFAQLLEALFKIGIREVELVDDDHAAEAALLGRFHHPAREKLRAARRVDHGADRFHGVECGKVLTKIVRVARGVEDVNADRRKVRHGRIHVRNREAD